MTATSVSVDAYHALDQESGQLKQFEQYVKDHGPCTRAMAGKALGFGANVYSARCNVLVKDGTLVELPTKAKCHVTDHTAGWLVHRKRVTLALLELDSCPDCRRDSGVYDQRKICCAARFAVHSGGDIKLTVEIIAHKYEHDLERLKLVVNAIQVDRRNRAMANAAGRPAANEGGQ